MGVMTDQLSGDTFRFSASSLRLPDMSPRHTRFLSGTVPEIRLSSTVKNQDFDAKLSALSADPGTPKLRLVHETSSGFRARLSVFFNFFGSGHLIFHRTVYLLCEGWIIPLFFGYFVDIIPVSVTEIRS